MATLFVLTIAARTHAVTFDEYRARVSQAVSAIEQLEAPGYFTDDPTQREAIAHNALTGLRNLLPPKETVFFNGQHIEADNTWLHEALDQFERISGQPERRSALIKRTRGQLEALRQRLDEMKVGASRDDKDASKARMAEILRRPEFDKSPAQQSAIERLWQQFLRWLAKLFPRMGPIQPGTSRGLSSIAQVVVIGLAVILIAFLIWRFLPRYLRSRGGKKSKQRREARIVLGERLEPDQSAADLLTQAEALARAGDLRGAIRKAYIALLCELGDRKVISLAQHKTNRDYLMSVKNRHGLYEALRKLTARFELHWYGFVPPAPNDWEEFRVGVRNASGNEARR